jgi:hypothetical protein
MPIAGPDMTSITTTTTAAVLAPAPDKDSITTPPKSTSSTPEKQQVSTFDDEQDRKWETIFYNGVVEQLWLQSRHMPNGTPLSPPSWFQRNPCLFPNRPKAFIKDWDNGEIRPRRMMDDFRQVKEEKRKREEEEEERKREAEEARKRLEEEAREREEKRVIVNRKIKTQLYNAAVEELWEESRHLPNGTPLAAPSWFQWDSRLFPERPRRWIKDWDTGRPRRMVDDFWEVTEEKRKREKKDDVNEGEEEVENKEEGEQKE